ncbi:MAG: hypothetical protein V1835_02945 [Candidatus Micrarchaeota archaeon]
MNLSAVLGFAALILVFAGVYAFGYDFATGKAKATALDFKPPYYYMQGEFVSYINAFFFVFVFSLLFFGYSAPIALGVEGAKYASLTLGGAIPIYDYAFLIPEVLAAYSAVLLGRGVLDDFEGKSIFEHWSAALRVFTVGFALVVVLFLLRGFVVK